MSEKYDVEFVCAAGPCRLSSSRAAVVRQASGGCSPYETWGPLFVIQSIGQGRNDTGFAMTAAEVVAWKRQYPQRCFKSHYGTKIPEGLVAGKMNRKREHGRRRKPKARAQ